MFSCKIGFVVDVFPSECAGIETIFIFVSSGGDNGAIELGILFDVDIKAPFTGKNSRLFFDTIIVAVQFVLIGTDTDVWRTPNAAR